MIDLDKLVQGANQLDPLPNAVLRLMDLMQKPDVAITEIEEAFAADGALTAQLLRQANSASSGASSQIGTVEAAVVRLGLDSVLALAVAASTQKHLNSSAKQYGLDEGDLWRHGQYARLAIDGMRRILRKKTPPEAQTAALLHDIGKIVMARYLKPDILAYLHSADQGDPNISLSAEREILNVHHGELGGLIAQHWKLPDIIVRSIIYHHTPEECTEIDNTICHMTCLANWVANAAACVKKEHAISEPFPESAKILDISREQADQLIAHVLKEYVA